MIIIRCFLLDVPKPLEFTASYTLVDSKHLVDHLVESQDVTQLSRLPGVHFWVPTEDVVEAIHIFSALPQRSSSHKVIVQTRTHRIVLSHTFTESSIPSFLDNIASTCRSHRLVGLRTDQDVLVVNTTYLRGILITDSKRNDVVEGGTATNPDNRVEQ
jgi:hypothetical protein